MDFNDHLKQKQPKHLLISEIKEKQLRADDHTNSATR